VRTEEVENIPLPRRLSKGTRASRRRGSNTHNHDVPTGSRGDTHLLATHSRSASDITSSDYGLHALLASSSPADAANPGLDSQTCHPQQGSPPSTGDVIDEEADSTRLSNDVYEVGHLSEDDGVHAAGINENQAELDASLDLGSIFDYGSFDGFSALLDIEPLSYDLPSAQATPFYLPIPISPAIHDGPDVDTTTMHTHRTNQTHIHAASEEPTFFSRFGSRLPSLQPDVDPLAASQRGTQDHDQNWLGNQAAPMRRLSDLSTEDIRYIHHCMSGFATVPSHFRLPTRLSLARYIRAYTDGFQKHLPFLHLQSLSIGTCAVELLLAMAAVGAQYCFEAEKGLELFHAAKAIATERIRLSDTVPSTHHVAGDHLTNSTASPESGSLSDNSRNSWLRPASTPDGAGGIPSVLSAQKATDYYQNKDDLMQSAQALLILMAMATWANHKEIFRDALSIQSILASIVRDDGLSRRDEDQACLSRADWIRNESVKRTKFVVYCFFNLHCILYDIPPLILTSELKMRLPCSNAEFEADTEGKWQEAKLQAPQLSPFQDALHSLFSSSPDHAAETHSSLGNYILVHAIIQHIFFVRQTARCRFDSCGLTLEDVAPLEQALRNWQLGWRRNPESSVDPMDPSGPIAFNATALLRLAYIRLNMDTGPGRALGTRDPTQIAHALRGTPPVVRGPKLVRALLHSAHALSIPIKIGIQLVARTQTFVWSIQHSLCSLECALLLSKWLEALSEAGEQALEPPISEHERRILVVVKSMLAETEFAVSLDKPIDAPETAKLLNPRMVRAWATIFKGPQTWAIVDVIGSSLNAYADMLDST